MQSSLISKIEKARIYAEQLERFEFTSLRCVVRGDSTTHTVELGRRTAGPATASFSRTPGPARTRWRLSASSIRCCPRPTARPSPASGNSGAEA